MDQEVEEEKEVVVEVKHVDGQVRKLLKEQSQEGK